MHLRARVAAKTARPYPTSAAARETRPRKRLPLLLIAVTLLARLRRSRRACSIAVLQPVVTLLFQFERQFLAALFDNPAGRKHVYEVRCNVIKQTLIVRDQNHGLVSVMKFVHAFSDDSQRINVQT